MGSPITLAIANSSGCFACLRTVSSNLALQENYWMWPRGVAVGCQHQISQTDMPEESQVHASYWMKNLGFALAARPDHSNHAQEPHEERKNTLRPCTTPQNNCKSRDIRFLCYNEAREWEHDLCLGPTQDLRPQDTFTEVQAGRGGMVSFAVLFARALSLMLPPPQTPNPHQDPNAALSSAPEFHWTAEDETTAGETEPGEFC